MDLVTVLLLLLYRAEKFRLKEKNEYRDKKYRAQTVEKQDDCKHETHLRLEF